MKQMHLIDRFPLLAPPQQMVLSDWPFLPNDRAVSADISASAGDISASAVAGVAVMPSQRRRAPRRNQPGHRPRAQTLAEAGRI